MLKRIAIAALLAAAGIANAATYNLSVTGQDPVAPSASYTPSPKVHYRVAGGAWTLIPSAVTGQVLSATAQITANSGDLVEVQAQSCNGVDNSCAAVQGPIPAYAPTDAQPFTGLGVTISR